VAWSALASPALTNERARLFPEPATKRKTVATPDENMQPPESPLDESPAGAAWHHPELPQARPRAEWGDAIRRAAQELGFARIGFSPIEPFESDAGRLNGWLAAGMQGEMTYMSGGQRADPRALLRGARSLIVVALPYWHERGTIALRSGPAEDKLRGFVARYARGSDYHVVIKHKLRQLADACAEIVGRPVLARPCVDSAPLLERAAARRAGIGFVAKSTMTIVPGLGSYVLLGELLTDIELTPGNPIPQQCGRCSACLSACPTGAFVDAYTLDARRCISYLTIELRGVIPRELRPLMGRMVFGCDICQEVCPFNHSPKPRPAALELSGRSELSDPELSALLAISSSDYRRLVRGTALRRVSRPCLQRNAAVALGNSGERRALAPLLSAVARNSSALVRLHAAWAIGRLGFGEALPALSAARSSDADEAVVAEIEWAINAINNNTL
jgi:epoxyqueuosine reductase